MIRYWPGTHTDHLDEAEVLEPSHRRSHWIFVSLHCGIVCEKKKTTSLSEATLVAYSTNRVKIERHCKTSSLHKQIV